MSSFDEIQNREAGLHKKLSAKQMGMIAIGGAIGTDCLWEANLQLVLQVQQSSSAMRLVV